jgi:hypothetical protein
MMNATNYFHLFPFAGFGLEALGPRKMQEPSTRSILTSLKKKLVSQ